MFYPDILCDVESRVGVSLLAPLHVTHTAGNFVSDFQDGRGGQMQGDHRPIRQHGQFSLFVIL